MSNQITPRQSQVISLLTSDLESEGEHNQDDEDFGLSSSDEADLLALNVDSVPNASEPETRISNDDDFGMSSTDEAELISLSQSIESPGIKRKASLNGDGPPAKRTTYPFRTYPSAIKALKERFKFEKFQLKQEQVISRLLSGGSAVMIFPTGGGKSLCYQIPALVFAEEDQIAGIRGPGEHGITLVVSPLIALMKDQVDALLRKGIPAASLDSSKTREEYLETCEMLRNGELKLLYCAPERLNNEGFMEQMKHVRGGVRLLAVDEAHCISEWGHAFRPDYLKITRFVEEIQAERVICLTATATPRVADDILNAFNIDKSGLFRTITYRPNLRLLAESAKTKTELTPRLVAFLHANPGPSIVYVTIQKHTEALSMILRTRGLKARAFHAGLETGVKTEIQNEFMKSADLVIVATIAFGMGIDKASIRNVVHFNIPNSLESYSQEIGRAGRDGQISICKFYVCAEDLHLREMFARGDLPSKESVRQLLEDIFDDYAVNVAPGGEIKYNHAGQEKDFDIRSTTLKNIYAQLEVTHGLVRAVTPIYTKYSYKTGPAYASTTRSDKSKAATAILNGSKKASKLIHIDVDTTASKYGLLRTDIIHKLNDWNEEEAIELKPSGVINVYKVLARLPQTSQEINNLVNAIYSLLQSRESQALARTDEVLALITSPACFSQSLAQHFGDSLPDGKKECGHCTWCLEHKAVISEKSPPVPFNKAAFKAILKKVQDRDDARFLARIAFGIRSPRITKLKLGKDPIFESMADHEFPTLLNAFATECSRANQKLS